VPNARCDSHSDDAASIDLTHPAAVGNDRYWRIMIVGLGELPAGTKVAQSAISAAKLKRRRLTGPGARSVRAPSIIGIPASPDA
jgi:hypothetical protein